METPTRRGPELIAQAERIADLDLRDRVVSGIKLLEQAVEAGRLDADWPDRIDPGDLLMSSPRACVLGQVFTSEEVTQDEARLYELATGAPVDETGFDKGIAILDGDLLDKSPAEFGFDAYPMNAGGAGLTFQYSELNAAWLLVLGANE